MEDASFLAVLLFKYLGTVLTVNMCQELELEPESEPDLWTKAEPVSEPKINNFGYAKLEKIYQ